MSLFEALLPAGAKRRRRSHNSTPVAIVQVLWRAVRGFRSTHLPVVLALCLSVELYANAAPILILLEVS